VAVFGDTIVVGDGQDDIVLGKGNAYIYTRSGNAWTEEAKLVPGDGAASEFGVTVATNGDTVVIGAQRENDDGIGGVYVYTRLDSVWTEQARLTASDGSTYDGYGANVSIDRNTIVIGAVLSRTVDDFGYCGAYVYTFSGAVWTEQAKLTASVGVSSSYFGRSVAIDGDTIVIGANTDNVEGCSGTCGSAYVYTRSGAVWTEQAKLTASDGDYVDDIGFSVAINGDTVVVGAYGDKASAATSTYPCFSGSPYVYTHFESGWTEQARLEASIRCGVDFFGRSVAIDGDTIVIGASGDDTDEKGFKSGSVYVYKRSDTIWNEQIMVTASDGSREQGFGYSVAFDGDSIVIGAFEQNTFVGKAYFFTT